MIEMLKRRHLAPIYGRQSLHSPGERGSLRHLPAAGDLALRPCPHRGHSQVQGRGSHKQRHLAISDRFSEEDEHPAPACDSSYCRFGNYEGPEADLRIECF